MPSSTDSNNAAATNTSNSTTTLRKHEQQELLENTDCSIIQEQLDSLLSFDSFHGSDWDKSTADIVFDEANPKFDNNEGPMTSLF